MDSTLSEVTDQWSRSSVNTDRVVKPSPPAASLEGSGSGSRGRGKSASTSRMDGWKGSDEQHGAPRTPKRLVKLSTPLVSCACHP